MKPGLGRFFFRVILWLVLLTAAWSQTSKWTSQPVAWLTHLTLETGASDWVRSVRREPGQIEVQTRLEVKVNGRIGEVVVEADTSRFCYGWPILWALLLAAGGPGLTSRLWWGMLALWPAQAFSLSMDLLKKMAMAAPGGTRQLHIDQWQLEAIALGYQAGTLLVPTLIPVLLWAWMDQRFIVQQLVQPVEHQPSG